MMLHCSSSFQRWSPWGLEGDFEGNEPTGRSVSADQSAVATGVIPRAMGDVSGIYNSFQQHNRRIM
jgi:hypothetical protein